MTIPALAARLQTIARRLGSDPSDGAARRSALRRLAATRSRCQDAYPTVDAALARAEDDLRSEDGFAHVAALMAIESLASQAALAT